jgi:hypothetical protein
MDIDVQVSMNRLYLSTAVAQFRFAPQTFVHSIDPSEGSVSGGTEVMVKGANMFTSIKSTLLCAYLETNQFLRHFYQLKS